MISLHHKLETEKLYDTADEFLTYKLQTGEALKERAEISDCTSYL